MNKNVIEKFLQYLLIELRYPKNTVIAYENDLKQLEALCAPEGSGSLGDWWKKFNSANIKMYKIYPTGPETNDTNDKCNDGRAKDSNRKLQPCVINAVKRQNADRISTNSQIGGMT